MTGRANQTDEPIAPPIRATSGTEEELLAREWIVTNGLGGYASLSVPGVLTRAFHGLLVAALPVPYGRVVMLNNIMELLRLPDGTVVRLYGQDRPGHRVRIPKRFLKDFRLESGLPLWRFEAKGHVIEKSLVMTHGQNTVHILYRMLQGDSPVKLEIRPQVDLRSVHDPVSHASSGTYGVALISGLCEIFLQGSPLPALRLHPRGAGVSFTSDPMMHTAHYSVEEARGYEHVGTLWSPGYFHCRLSREEDAGLIASTESWETVHALTTPQAFHAEQERRWFLLEAAPPPARHGVAAELCMAADQFLITPAGRIEDSARAHAAGDEIRTEIAGYHWFTDWGRDAMISLEGLTLSTGRRQEARWILRTFAYYIRDGLIPNLFPEGKRDGLYHTADATLWFFHAVERYLRVTNDRETLKLLLPKLLEVVDLHLHGTRFGIVVDPEDGLLRQGEDKYALTWMDAKVGDWVVTPRRGKAVEINALWYNALLLLARWVSEERTRAQAEELRRHAERARRSFNERFWYAEGGYLFDLVDGESGDDPACRPNQIFSFSLDHPILEGERWGPVLEVVASRLLTPVGLRSLAPGHRDYKDKYFGDLRSRDAAYHQGTVWAWLIGPFVDAWIKVHPDDSVGARRFLDGFVPHLKDGGLGTISEIFDAELPFTPRGCIAQAWSVAEVLRAWLLTEPSPTVEPGPKTARLESHA